MRATTMRFERKPLTPKDAQRAIKLYKMGYSIAKISRYLDYYEASVRKAFRENGIETRTSSEGVKLVKGLKKIDEAGV